MSNHRNRPQEQLAVVDADPVFNNDSQCERSLSPDHMWQNRVGDNSESDADICDPQPSDCATASTPARLNEKPSFPPIALPNFAASSNHPSHESCSILTDLNKDGTNTISSLDEGDVPFSQELSELENALSSSDEDTYNSDDDITNEEVFALHDAGMATCQGDSADMNAYKNVIEDYWSALFCAVGDEDMEREIQQRHTNSGTELVEQHIHSTSFLTEDSRSLADRQSGLPGWEYISAFANVEMEIDNVDSFLAPKFVTEANQILQNVYEDISVELKAGSLSANDNDNNVGSNTARDYVPSRLDIFNTMLPTSLLEKVKEAVNRVLTARQKRPVIIPELQAAIALHVLCASYGESAAIVSCPDNSDFFYQMALTASRYREIWSALSCCKKKRSRVEYNATGWANKPSRGNALITEMEEECAAVNRRVLYIPGASIFSLDDDHLRLSSRAVTQYTNLQQLNNPSKALGPVSNALCSALNPVILACHYSRPREKVTDVWERLVQLVQGAPTRGSISPMTDAIFAADRGYNSKETIRFLNETLSATGLGTHKRSLDFPFVFGDGPLAKKHKGMPVSEKGCRAIYRARKKASGGSGRSVEAAVYRESASGRVAAMYHNNERLFATNKFTLVPRDSFREEVSGTKIDQLQTVFERLDEGRSHAHSNRPRQNPSSARMKVEQVLLRVTQLTLLQSEDPGWFLARAFSFTSRTSHEFITTVASNFDAHINGLSKLLKGRTITPTAVRLSDDGDEVRRTLLVKWSTVLTTLNISKREIVPSVLPGSVSTFLNTSEQRMRDMRKDDILKLLVSVGRRHASSLRKQELVQKVVDIQKAVKDGTDVLQEPEDLDDAARMDKDAKSVTSALLKAALSSWVMRPLVATAGMKEGSLNEIEVLKALPAFMENSTCVKTSMDCESGIFPPDQDDMTHLRVDYTKSLGLVCSKQNEMIGDSPDGLCGIVKSSGDVFCAVVEIKTMTSPRTIENAKTIAALHGNFTRVGRVGSSNLNDKIFQKLVPSTSYRLQCLHHATVFQVEHVLFVVAKGSSMGKAGIIYTVLIEFSSILRNSYVHCLEEMQSAAFSWVGGPSTSIPETFDTLLKSSFAADLHSFASFYGLSMAYKALVKRNGTPLPPARMIRPTLLVFWNALKGGVDEYSRAMKTLTRTNASENPIVSIVGRILCSQVNNAAIVHRLAVARKRGILPSTLEKTSMIQNGYNRLRHNVSKYGSFGEFARGLAREINNMMLFSLETARIQRNFLQSRRRPTRKSALRLTPMYSLEAAKKYNRSADTERRLGSVPEHISVMAQSTYCALCSYTYVFKYRGKNFTKKGGSRQKQWCNICKQAICRACWNIWHSSETLVRAAISEEEKRAFHQFVREKHNK